MIDAFGARLPRQASRRQGRKVQGFFNKMAEIHGKWFLGQQPMC